MELQLTNIITNELFPVLNPVSAYNYDVVD